MNVCRNSINLILKEYCQPDAKEAPLMCYLNAHHIINIVHILFDKLEI